MFATRLTTLRTARGLTQEALAKKAQTTQPYVAALESGSQDNPTLDTVKRLAKALKCKVSDLVE